MEQRGGARAGRGAGAGRLADNASSGRRARPRRASPTSGGTERVADGTEERSLGGVILFIGRRRRMTQVRIQRAAGRGGATGCGVMFTCMFVDVKEAIAVRGLPVTGLPRASLIWRFALSVNFNSDDARIARTHLLPILKRDYRDAAAPSVQRLASCGDNFDRDTDLSSLCKRACAVTSPGTPRRRCDYYAYYAAGYVHTSPAGIPHLLSSRSTGKTKRQRASHTCVYPNKDI
ncbi:hypothetical protein EVAR_68961_1 [Eumeta japonica]|uniref:Uncharacterized protein n=1 Tax=Eumeta variegata TaxID=151549 RepID=A0A4C2A876_EUMVA|nr:hypothetical protein EVAR_68961_1 [Eumeta japonica]